MNKKILDHRQLAYAAFAVLVVLLFIAGQRIQPAERFLSIGMISQESGSLQVFFDTGSGFSEAESKHVQFRSGDADVNVPLPPGELKSLRLDPAPGIRSLLVKSLDVSVPRAGTRSAVPLSGLHALNEVKGLTLLSDGVRVDIAEGAKDAQLLLPAGITAPVDLGSARLAGWGKALVGLVMLLWVAFHLARSPAGLPLPALLLAVVVLVATLALTSTTSHSIHPDEHNHVAAARYYFNHWKPPAVDDPAIVDTYTIYGTSYLNELDVGYLVAAKVSNLWSGFGLDDTVSLRLFNVLLLTTLLIIAWRGKDMWAGAAALLVTPQLWYVFSYFNADAFPIFLSVVAAFLYASPTSAVSDYIEGRSTRLWPLLVFVLALGLLLVSKRNYLLVALFIGLMLSVRHLRLPMWCVATVTAGAFLLGFSVIGGQNMPLMFPRTAAAFMPVGGALLLFAALVGGWKILKDPGLRPRLYRFSALFIVAIAIAFPRVLLDRDVNGGSAEKAQKTLAAAEKHGELRFKPSTLMKDPASSYPGRNLAAKGVTLGQIMGQPYGWTHHSWRSSLGVYGYMNAFSPSWLYVLISCGLLLCLAALLWHATRDAPFRKELGIVGSVALLVVLSSVVHSWAYDFQPQGRYLMPIVAFLSALAIAHPALLRSRTMALGIMISFLGSLFSFLFFAIPVLANR